MRPVAVRHEHSQLEAEGFVLVPATDTMPPCSAKRTVTPVFASSSRPRFLGNRMEDLLGRRHRGDERRNPSERRVLRGQNAGASSVSEPELTPAQGASALEGSGKMRRTPTGGDKARTTRSRPRVQVEAARRRGSHHRGRDRAGPDCSDPRVAHRPEFDTFKTRAVVCGDHGDHCRVRRLRPRARPAGSSRRA